MAARVAEITEAAEAEIAYGSIKGWKDGYQRAKMDMVTDPVAATEVLDQMAPKAREQIFKKFQKGWLTRMFGG